MMNDEYRAYMLRLWLVEDDGRRWRASLEDVATGEMLGFASLEKLMDYLQSLRVEGQRPGKERGEERDGL